MPATPFHPPRHRLLVAALGLTVAGIAQSAPFGAAPVNVPILQYTGKFSPVLPEVTTPTLQYTGGGKGIAPVTTPTFTYTGSIKGIPAVTTPTLSYKAKG